MTFPPHPPRCAQHLLLEEKAAHGPTVPAGRRHKKYRPPKRVIGIFGGGRWISPDGDKLRLHLPRKEKYRPSKRTIGIFGGGRWIRTIEGIASRFTVCPLWPLGNSPICNLSEGGAGRRTRTPDLLITNQLLYQLSYTSISATEWILADAAPFVKPKFFIFREEGLLHFKICSPAEKRRPYGRPCGRCSLCGCELLRGEHGWYLNGQSVCADCFPAFARAELAPCETVFGMEGEA